ncbi:MAG: galactitol-1-phosphate 5-dehydrogenase [Planctomycetales bacterium]|nr:galactitol-1-phosphate 5-dehydrogenase [Planctomycetales bacterium]
MKALLLTDTLTLEMTEMPTPEVGDKDVLIRVHSCGICGSDVHGWDGSSGRRIPPLVMGHEAAGEVAAVGSQVKSIHVGDRVTFDSMISCGSCAYCWRGEMNLCDSRRVLGVSCGDYRQHGAFADYVVVPQHIVFRLPDSVPYHHAAMVEPISVAVHAVERMSIRLGDTALVVGSGMIGLLILQCLRLAGCQRVFATDLDDSRLELATQLGATEVWNAGSENVVERIREATQGQGCDISMEAVGNTAGVECAIQATRKGGAVTLVGNIKPRIDFALQSVVTRELSVLGSCASSGEYPRCIELLSTGAIDVDPLISARAPLEEGLNWFQRLYKGESGLMKVLLEPTRS